MGGTVAVVELRQYTLHPGTRETLIDLFETQFIESQEACGMRVVGQFRDLDRPDRFVWLRAFDDMESRRRALEGFYTGPVWMAHRDAANATMIDSDNVLLLRPAASGEVGAGDEHTAIDATAGGIIVATIYSLDPAAKNEDEDTDDNDAEDAALAAFAEWFRTHALPCLAEAGMNVFAQLVTEPARNTFPRLPVREGDRVFVWFAAYPDRASYDAAARTLAELPAWRDDVALALRALTRGEPETLVLAPTRRSSLTAITASAALTVGFS